MKKLATGLLCVTLVSACGWMNDDKGLVQNRQNDYLQAEPEAPLQIPDGLDKALIQDVYVIPPVVGNPLLEKAGTVPAPVALTSSLDENAVRIQKLGSDQWIVLSASPGNIWYGLQQFLVQNNMSIAKEKGNVGLIETIWLKMADSSEQERFLFRVEQGLQRNSAEVFVKQIQSSTPHLWDGQWNARSDDSDREAKMLQALAEFLAQQQQDNQISFLAQAISSSKRLVMLHDENDRLFLQVDASWNRAWASMALAVEKAGFDLVDSNMQKGEFYLGAKEKKGKSWFGGDDAKSMNRPFDYILRLSKGSNGVEVRVVDKKGELMNEADSAHVLNRVKGSLS